MHDVGLMQTFMTSCGSQPCNSASFNTTSASWFEIQEQGRVLGNRERKEDQRAELGMMLENETVTLPGVYDDVTAAYLRSGLVTGILYTTSSFGFGAAGPSFTPALSPTQTLLTALRILVQQPALSFLNPSTYWSSVNVSVPADANISRIFPAQVGMGPTQANPTSTPLGLGLRFDGACGRARGCSASVPETTAVSVLAPAGSLWVAFGGCGAHSYTYPHPGYRIQSRRVKLVVGTLRVEVCRSENRVFVVLVNAVRAGGGRESGGKSGKSVDIEARRPSK
ncbi:hypothetical protein BT96DRAFT_974610 [Gymnopus androsaceus JB14]|uniref:Uncharacterized protein n=1 Tax=Gymnopus androsaceus JB14 TaxID=1447944 RepID=A0A6A4HVX6_9AGAR|nr:hypothetical protein BT96DRAFT_974610 [Gymnopus androsaceus JB14]